MKSMVKYIILFSIIISNPFVRNKLNAQNYEETLEFASDQYEQHNYTIALKTFKRLIFFSSGDELLPLYTKVGEIAFLLGDFETSQFNYGLAYNLAESDSLKNELLFKKAYSQILNKEYQYAVIDLLAVNDHDKATKQRLNFYLGTCYFGLEQFDRSKKYFELCVQSEDIASVDLMFSDKDLYYPSPKKARIMSMLLPGLGQFYIGKYKDGLNSFFLTLGLMAIGVRTAVNTGVVFALVSVAPWFQRYYTGGYTNAEKLAVVKRQNNRSSIYNGIIDLVKKNKVD